MSDNIKVVVKVRPLIKREIDENSTIQWNVRDNSLVQIDQNGKDTTYKFYFDRVYDQKTETSNLYDEIAKPIVEAATAGINGTIFAYGQTSSGKTYTMMGDENSLGIIPLSVYNIFEKIQSIPDRDFLLRVSYIEIYNEKIRDLLCYSKKDIKIHETVQGNIKVDATEEVTTSPEHVLELMKQGEGNREIGSTNMNEQSSRSHTIFQIIIESRLHTESSEEGDGYVNVSMLNLVDLAGSERSGQTGATGQRFKEGTHINKSLSSLGLVIKQLSEDQNKFINYRDSKLTRILQNSLGGNAKTSIICAVTPAVLEETISTLQFACRAKAIKNKPEVNAVVTNATMLQALTKKLAALQYELENKRHLEHDNQMLSQKIEELQHKILNGIVTRPERQKVAHNRRQTWCAPRRASISHPGLSISESEPSKLPAFITPSLNRYKGDPSADNKVTLRSCTISERDEEESFLQEASSDISMDMVTPVRRKNVNFKVNEVIELDDSTGEKNLTVRPCSPYHLCYDTSQTPPCVLRENSRHAEQKFKDLLELTEIEKIYAPKEMELIKKLEDKIKQVQFLEEAAEKGDLKCNEYISKCTLLESTLHEKEVQWNQTKRQMEEEIDTMKGIVLLTKKERDATLQASHKEIESLRSKLTDLEFSLETLKQKSKQRESELLSLLQHSTGGPAGPGPHLGLHDADPEQRSFNFLDMSKDFSLIGSDNDMSSIQNDVAKLSELANADKLIREKNKRINDMQRKLDNQQIELEAVQKQHTSTIDKLNKEMAVLKEDLENSRKDVESYCNFIQDIKKPNVDRSRGETKKINDTSDQLFHIEDGLITNNKILSATIEKFKKKVESKNKEILELKALKETTDVDCQTDGIVSLNISENKRIAVLEKELSNSKCEITENEKNVSELKKIIESKYRRKGEGDITVEAEPQCCKHDHIIQENTQKILVLEEEIAQKQNKIEELCLYERVEECRKCKFLLQEIFSVNQTLTAQNSDINNIRTKVNQMRKTLENRNDIVKDIKIKQLKIADFTEQCTKQQEKIASLENNILELVENNSLLNMNNEEYCKRLDIALEKCNTLEEKLQSRERKLEESSVHIEELKSEVKHLTSTLKEPDNLACNKLYAEKETHINSLIAENTELNVKLSEYLHELTKLKVELQVQTQLQESASACQEKIVDMLQELNHKDEILKQLTHEKEDINNKVIDQCNQIRQISVEIQKKNDVLEEIKQLVSSYEIQLSEQSKNIDIITQSSNKDDCPVQSLTKNCEMLRAEKHHITQDLELQLQTIQTNNNKLTSSLILQWKEYKRLSSLIDCDFKALTAANEALNKEQENCLTIAHEYENKLKENVNEQNRLQALVHASQKELKDELEVQLQLRDKITKIGHELNQKDQQVNQMTCEKEDLNNKVIEYCKQISELNVRIQETSCQLDKIQHLVSSYEIQLSEKSEEVEIIRQSSSDANNKVQTLTENCELLKAQLEEKHNITQDLQLQLETIQNDNFKLKSDLNQHLEDYKCLRSEVGSKLTTLTVTNEVLDKDHKKCRTIIDDYETKLQENICEQNQLYALITSYQKELSDAKQYCSSDSIDEILLAEKEISGQDIRDQIFAIKNDHIKLTNDLNIELEKYKKSCLEKDDNLTILNTTNEILNKDLVECHHKIHNLETQIQKNIEEQNRLHSLITTFQNELSDARQELQNMCASGDKSLNRQLLKNQINIEHSTEKNNAFENDNLQAINDSSVASQCHKLLLSDKDSESKSLNAVNELQISPIETKLQEIILLSQNALLHTAREAQYLCIISDTILTLPSSASEIIKKLQCQLETITNENYQFKIILKKQLDTYKQICFENDVNLNTLTATHNDLKIKLTKCQNTIKKQKLELSEKDESCNFSDQVQLLNDDTYFSKNKSVCKDKELELLHEKREEADPLQFLFSSLSQERDDMRTAYDNVVQERQQFDDQSDNCVLGDTNKSLNKKKNELSELHVEIKSLKNLNHKLQEQLLALNCTKVNSSQSVQTSKPTDVLIQEDALSDDEKKLIIELEIDKTKCDILENIKDVQLLQGQLNNLKCFSSTEDSRCESDSHNLHLYTEHLFPENTKLAVPTDTCNKFNSELDSTAKKDSALTTYAEICSNEASLQKNANSFSSQIQLLKTENEKLKTDIRKLIKTNVQLVGEKKDIGALLKETEELHGRIVWHRTNLCTLTATTHAENKLLSSKLSALQHKHARLHIVCEKANKEFKVHLQELYQLLQSNPKLKVANNSYFSPRPSHHTNAETTLLSFCSFQPCDSVCNNSDYQGNISMDVNNVSVIEHPRLFTSILEEMSFAENTITQQETADTDRTMMLNTELQNMKSMFTQTDDSETYGQLLHNDPDIPQKYQMAKVELVDMQKKIDKLSEINQELQQENDALSNNVMDHIIELDNLKSEFEAYEKKDSIGVKSNPLQSYNRMSPTIESQQEQTLRENIISNFCHTCLTRSEHSKEQSQQGHSTLNNELNDSDKENGDCNKFDLTHTALEELKKEHNSLKNEINQTKADCKTFIQERLENSTELLQANTSLLDMIKFFYEILKNNDERKNVSLKQKNIFLEKELQNINNKLTTLNGEVKEKNAQLFSLNEYKESTILQLQKLKDECDSLKHTSEEMKDEFMDYVLVTIGNADFVDSSERNSSYLHIMKKVLHFNMCRHTTELEALNLNIKNLHEENLILKSNLQRNCHKCMFFEQKLVSQETENDSKINIFNMQVKSLNEEKCDLLQQLHEYDDKCRSLDLTCQELQKTLTRAEEEILTLQQAKIAFDAQILQYQSLLSNNETLHRDNNLILNRVKDLELKGEKLREINKVLCEKNEMSVQQVIAYEVLINESKAQYAVLEKKLSQMEVKCVEVEGILQTKFAELSTEKSKKEELNARIQVMQREQSELQKEIYHVKQDLGQAKQELFQAKQELGESQQQSIQVTQDLGQLQQRYQASEAQLNQNNAANILTTTRLQTEMESLKLKLIEKDASLMESQNKLQELLQRCQTFEQQCEECTAKLKTVQDEVANYQAVNRILETRVDDLQNEVDEVRRNASTTSAAPAPSPALLRRKRQSLHDAVRQQPESDVTNSSEVQQQNSQLLAEIDRMRSEAQDIKKLGAVLSNYKNQCANLQDENKKLLRNNESLTRLLKDKQSELNQVNKAKQILETKVIELDQRLPKQNNKGALLKEACTNTDQVWGNDLMSVVVDRMTHEAALDKNKQLTKHNQQLSQQLQRQQQLANERDDESSELHILKKELAASKVAYTELEEKYREVDEECEICAKYLREKEAAYDRLCATKESLEAKVSELLGQLDGETKHSVSVTSARKKRQSLYDQRRSSAGNVCDVATNTDKQELPGYTNLVDKMTYEAEKDRCRKLQKTLEELRMRVSEQTQELRRLQRHHAAAAAHVTDDDDTVAVLRRGKDVDGRQCQQELQHNAELEQQQLHATAACPTTQLPQHTLQVMQQLQLQQLQLRNTELEQQLLRASVVSPTPPLLLAPGSAVVQSQQLCDYVEENYRLKKMNTKLMKLVKSRQAKKSESLASEAERD